MLAPLAAAVTPPKEAAATAVEQPNIILITTDDQALSDLRYMPYTLELLGGGGVTFDDAISPYPLCCPARASILTGQQAHNHHVLSNEPPMGGYQAMRPLNDKSLPVWMENAGYRTTFAGKYLNEYGKGNPREVPAGWDDFHATVYHPYDYVNAWVNDNGTVVDHTGEYQADMTQRVTEEAIRHGVDEGEPFFIWQSNLAPHGACPHVYNECSWGPATPAQQDVGTFAGLPMYAEGLPSFDERVVVEKPRRIRRLPRLRQDLMGEWRRLNQANVESLQAVDRNVRDTVELLDELGQLDNTLIVFASDNGYLLGQHRWRGKTLGYEESVRIPMLMRGPGVPQGKVIDKTVSLVDVAATFADVSGATPLLKLDGLSLLDVAQGRSNGYDAMAIEAGPALAGVPDDQYLYRGVRTKRYTYMRHPVTGEVELYDRLVDPYQLVNVAYRPTHRATRQALESLLARLSNCAGDGCHNAQAVVPDPEPPQGPVHPDELGSLEGAHQVVTVTAPRWEATRGVAVAWQKRGLSWHAVRGPVRVALGSSGMSATARRPAGATPAGSYRIASAFGMLPDQNAALGYRLLGETDRWVQDPRSSRTYNLLQPGRPRIATWRRTRETLFADYPGSFERGLVLAFNRPRKVYWAPKRKQLMARVPADVRRGSLLVHTGRRVGRQGWVSMPTRDLSWLTRWANPARGTRVVIGTPKYLRDTL